MAVSILQLVGALVEFLRIQALQLNSKIASILQKPEDILLSTAFSPTIWMSIRIGVELNLFQIVSEKGICSAQELAKKSGGDETLIRRILRPLTAVGYVSEKGPGVYGATKISKQLHQRVTIGMVRYMYDIGMPAIAEAPNWLARNKFQNPGSTEDGPWQKSFGVEHMPFFQWLALPENKQRWDDANTFFEGDRAGRLSWVDWFPVREKLLEGSVDDSPLLVDVAGGRGHDLLEFHERFPEHGGKLILQDQQPVLDSVSLLPARIEKRAIDFFKERPVAGARVYFLKFILHDWSDENCLRILENVKGAMKRGYSYLVINDFILPDEKCPLLPAKFDLILMVYMCAMERTQSMWKTLLGSAGLNVEGLYQPPGIGQGIIVATLP